MYLIQNIQYSCVKLQPLPIRLHRAAWSAAIKLMAVWMLIMWLCQPAAAAIPKLITLKTDADNIFNYISPGGGPQPVIWMTLCADVFIGADPVPGETVTFSSDADFWYVLSATSAVTNANGQAIVQIKPMYGAPPATITAKWVSGGKTYTAQVPITPTGNDCQALNATPAAKPALPTPCAILTYYVPFNNATRFSGEAQAAQGNWHSFTGSARVNFIDGNAQNDELEYIDFCDSSGSGILARSGRNNANNFAQTQFNIYYLDGNPNDTVCPSLYPPRSSQHALLYVATHEVGHDLLFEHNNNDVVSIMWPDLSSYFLCGTQAPTADESSAFIMAYPPCP